MQAIPREFLKVIPSDAAGPWMRVLLDQVDEIKAFLDANQIRYWVDEEAISINGLPYVTVINFGRNADASTLQAVLDTKY